jgi:TolB-like protein
MGSLQVCPPRLHIQHPFHFSYQGWATMSTRQRIRRALTAGLSIAAAACGGSALQLNDVTPESVPALESARAQNPADAATATRLGVGYFRANQLTEARAILDSLVSVDRQNGIAAIYLGMTAESQGDFTAARASYSQFTAVARSNTLKNTARQRLALVDRRELEFGARQALAQEAQLSESPPEPNTVAVMPFSYSGSNEEVRPLGRGLAQLLVTDLARSRQLRVLERERMQAMLDEMQLSEQGRADPQSALRSGRMLAAGRVVQGSLTDTENALRADASVVDVSTATIQPPASSALPMNRLFDMEKALAIQLFNNMGITLTDAERQAFNARPTQSLQAFLAWSRGLEAQDGGDFVGAQDFFNQAVRLDPGFTVAAQNSQQAGDLQQASTQTVAEVDLTVTANVGQETGGAPSAQDRQDALNSGSNGINPQNTPTTESTENRPAQPPADNRPPGTVQPPGPATTPTAVIRIIIPRP